MKFPPTILAPKSVDIPQALFFSIFAAALMNIILLTYLRQYITAFEDIQQHKFVFYNGIKQIMWILGLFLYMPLHSFALYLGYEHYGIPVYLLAILTGFVWMFWDIMPLMMMHDAQLHSFWLVFDIFACGLFWVWSSFFLFRLMGTPTSTKWMLNLLFFFLSNVAVFYVFYVFNRDEESERSLFVKLGDSLLSLVGMEKMTIKRVEKPIRLDFLENHRVLV